MAHSTRHEPQRGVSRSERMTTLRPRKGTRRDSRVPGIRPVRPVLGRPRTVPDVRRRTDQDSPVPPHPPCRRDAGGPAPARDSRGTSRLVAHLRGARRQGRTARRTPRPHRRASRRPRGTVPHPVDLDGRRHPGRAQGRRGLRAAGRAYHPEAHLRHIVRTAGIDVVLTTSDHVLRTARPSRHDHRDRHPARGRRVPPQHHPGPEPDIAVVIFTSGTTGQPNGVQVSHANLCNVLLTAPGSLGVTPGTRVSQLLNIAFDMAMWEILGTLAHGGTLVIRGDDLGRTASTVDVVIATPSVLADAGSRCVPPGAHGRGRR